jgi:hypothetical protein
MPCPDVYGLGWRCTPSREAPVGWAGRIVRLRAK